MYHGEIDDQHEHRHDEELHIWIEAEAAQQYRVLVIDILVCSGSHFHLDEMVVVAGHLLQRAVAYGLVQTVGQILPVAVGQFGEGHGVSRTLVGQREIAEFGDVSLVVAYHHRNGIVGGDDVEKKLHVGIDINLGKTFRGLGPDVHTLTLLYA